MDTAGLSFDGLLMTISSASAAVIAIVVSISLVVTQSTADKYPESVVNYVAREPSGANVLRMLFVTLSVSVGTLVLARMGVLVPRFGALAASGLAVTTMAVLIVYRDEAFGLFHPSGIAYRLGLAISRRLNRVATLPRRTAGPSVDEHLRRLTERDLDRIDDLFLSLLERGQHKEAAESMVQARYLCVNYIRQKRFIPSTSLWFPYREVPIEGESLDFSIRHIFEELALGTPRGPKQDRHWFEKRFFSSWDRVKEEAVRREAGPVIGAMLVSLGGLLVSAFKEQEMETLRSVMRLVEDLQEAQVLSKSVFLGPSLVDLFTQFADHVMRFGLDIPRLERALEGRSLESEIQIWQEALPTILTEELLERHSQLKSEKRLIGQIITPREWLVEKIMTEMSSRNDTAIQEYVRWCVVRLEGLVQEALTTKSADLTEHSLLSLVIIAHRALIHGRPVICLDIGDVIVSRLAATLEMLASEAESRRDIGHQLKILVFRSARDQPHLI